MPPPPPPGPPPPPAAPSGRGPKPSGKNAGGGAPNRNALLSSIQQGKALKKTVTNDRSSPLVGGTKTSNNTQGSSNLNGGPKFPPGGSKPSINRSENGNGETPRLPGIGGLFAGGMPQLKPSGSRGINSGKTSETGGPSGPGRGGFGTNRPTPQNTGSMSSINTNTSNSAQFTGSGARPPSSTSNHSSNISNSHSSSSLNSNPSLTPSASPSISNTRKNGPAPPPPPPTGAHGRPSVTGRPPHPAAKPPPPPLPPSQNKGNPGTTGNPAMRAKSFNHGGNSSNRHSLEHRSSKDDIQLGGDASNHQGAPVPPVRSSSAQQSNNGPFQQGSRTTGRRTGPAPAPPIQRPSRPPPMRPPTQPPPPPPVTNHPGGRNQSSHPPPPPPPMQHQVKPSYNNSHSNNNAPTPPTRKTSIGPGGPGQGDQNYGGSFEARFASMFKTPQFLPPPEPFIATTKTYPSKNTTGTMVNRGANNMKRAPAPPPPPPPGQSISMRS